MRGLPPLWEGRASARPQGEDCACRDRCGSILMEFVLVAPLILLLVSFVLQFAHIWTARQMTAYAAYCATRAALVVPPGEQEAAAKKAAELACSWMTLVGLPESVVAARNQAAVSKRVYLGRLHGRKDVSEYQVYYENTTPFGGEVAIPGWGTIPGSDSAKVRVAETEVVPGYNGTGDPVIAVTVKFKFPLVLPLAGRMVSWAANRDAGEGLEKFDYGQHKLKGGNKPAWAGQEVVMNKSGESEERGSAHNSSSHADGKFPFIELVETCVLPMPYSTARFPSNGFRRDSALSGDAVSDLIKGYEL